eukprot:TRINITY_DN4125_c0_g1_i1.p1 TRINITY_DN4125_c0_g1~~TRINITY_DN4125_c0_g1_i1.p1  ORF type:complete len:646 (+),score=93.08 TRINITY_DN4125_c0_g1_i1:173-2110(+)
MMLCNDFLKRLKTYPGFIMTILICAMVWYVNFLGLDYFQSIEQEAWDWSKARLVSLNAADSFSLDLTAGTHRETSYAHGGWVRKFLSRYAAVRGFSAPRLNRYPIPHPERTGFFFYYLIPVPVIGWYEVSYRVRDTYATSERFRMFEVDVQCGEPQLVDIISRKKRSIGYDYRSDQVTVRWELFVASHEIVISILPLQECAIVNSVHVKLIRRANYLPEWETNLTAVFQSDPAQSAVDITEPHPTIPRFPKFVSGGTFDFCFSLLHHTMTRAYTEAEAQKLLLKHAQHQHTCIVWNKKMGAYLRTIRNSANEIDPVWFDQDGRFLDFGYEGSTFSKKPALLARLNSTDERYGLRDGSVCALHTDLNGTIIRTVTKTHVRAFGASYTQMMQHSSHPWHERHEPTIHVIMVTASRLDNSLVALASVLRNAALWGEHNVVLTVGMFTSTLDEHEKIIQYLRLTTDLEHNAFTDSVLARFDQQFGAFQFGNFTKTPEVFASGLRSRVIRIGSYLHFNKAKALTICIDSIPPSDVVFVTDADIYWQPSRDIFHLIREYTLRGVQIYAPIVQVQKKSEWMTGGFGMLAVYKSDYESTSGGFNRTIGLNFRYGNEDTAMVILLSSLGYGVVRYKEAGFQHMFHVGSSWTCPL